MRANNTNRGEFLSAHVADTTQLIEYCHNAAAAQQCPMLSFQYELPSPLLPLVFTNTRSDAKGNLCELYLPAMRTLLSGPTLDLDQNVGAQHRGKSRSKGNSRASRKRVLAPIVIMTRRLTDVAVVSV